MAADVPEAALPAVEVVDGPAAAETAFSTPPGPNPPPDSQQPTPAARPAWPFAAAGPPLPAVVAAPAERVPVRLAPTPPGWGAAHCSLVAPPPSPGFWMPPVFAAPYPGPSQAPPFQPGYPAPGYPPHGYLPAGYPAPGYPAPASPPLPYATPPQTPPPAPAVPARGQAPASAMLRLRAATEDGIQIAAPEGPRAFALIDETATAFLDAARSVPPDAVVPSKPAPGLRRPAPRPRPDPAAPPGQR